MGVLVLVLPLVLLASAFAGLIQADNCGVQDLQPDASGRLVGASETVYGEFPWMAALHYTQKSNGYDGGIRCGGFIIGSRFILTAAHCLHVDKFRLDKVWLGVRKITEAHTSDVDKVRTFDILDAIPHEKYNAVTGINDIALLKLKTEITPSSYIREICLPASNAALPPSGTMLTVAGWGAIKSGPDGEQDSDLKLKVDVPMFNHAECEGKLGHAIKPEQFCAEGEYLKGTCWGDGGAPLMQSLPVGAGRLWYAIGLVSGVEGCGNAGTAIVHTRVASYVNWIQQTMSKP